MPDVMAGLDWANGTEIFEALFTPAGRADPYSLYAALHDLGDSLVLPEQLIAVSYTAVNELLRSPAFLVQDAARLDDIWPPWREHPALLQQSILTTNDPEHARVRSVVAGTFTPRRVAQLEPAIAVIADGLVAIMADEGADGTPVDFMARFAYQLPVTVICELLGVPESDRAVFRPKARDLARGIDFMSDMETLAVADAAALWMHQYFSQLAALRRAEPRDDLVGALVRAADADRGADDGKSADAGRGAGGGMSDAELLANLTLLMFAGFETTTNLLGNGLQLILTRPDIEAALRSDELPVADFVSEVLRYDAPVQASVDRWAPADAELCGQPVAAGTQLIAMIGAANRDPRRFASPDTFDPGRADAGALSFGAGPHYCLGASLARLEAAVAFPLLLASFPKLAAAGEPVRRENFALRGFDQLPISVC